MEASSVTGSSRPAATARDWAWWRLPWVLRTYTGIVPLAALAAIGVAAAQMSWRSGDLVKFSLLLGCGMISVAATARVAHLQSGMLRDFLTVWVLPVAILLPPLYAMVTPIPLLILTQWRVHRGLVYRRVFTAAAIGLAYGAGSLFFHAIPSSFAGGTPGSGRHALTWTAAVAACEIIGWLGHHVLLVSAVKLSDPTARLADLELNREALLADFAQIDLGILITVVVAVNPVLAVFAVPTVLLARRFMMHAQLVAKSRIDTKTGLLNPATWESEAIAEISRAVRTRSPLAVALMDIDHFKVVNDTHGHLAGDKALRAVTQVLREQLRSYDLAGRFGGEEFAILLPQTNDANALSIAERLRAHIAAMSIPVDDEATSSARISLTVSVGIAVLDDTHGELPDLLAAADAALYQAKQGGRNKTRLTSGNVPLDQIVPVARQESGAMGISNPSLRLPARPVPAPDQCRAGSVPCRISAVPDQCRAGSVQGLDVVQEAGAR
jgi:diguanylate cyclase (GGDEF)-like protein